jgi:hypothetical protein
MSAASTAPAQASGAAPSLPAGPAPSPAPAPAVIPAPPAPGAAQPTPAGPPKRTRNVRGPTVLTTGTASTIGIPALLEIGAANPLYTDIRREENTFVPNATHLFHMLGVCDLLMSQTHRFTQSSPGWIPIVSHLYISILWLIAIIRVRVETRYGSPNENELYRDLCDNLQILDLIIPGPLVPFFVALASAAADKDWIGDFMPGMPTITELFAGSPHINNMWLRLLPFPLFLLDALIHFARVDDAQGSHTAFEWTRNIFSTTGTPTDPTHTDVAWNRLGPNFVAPLYATSSQHDNARTFWKTALATPTYSRYTRASVLTLSNFAQFTGFADNNGTFRLNWFTACTTIMQKYSFFFNGSIALKDISPTQLGAIIPRGIPTANAATRDWLYPARAPGTQTSNSFTAINALPHELRVAFQHADTDLEQVAEQYAVTTHVNVDWSQGNNTQNGWTQIAQANTHVGSAWTFAAHRRSSPLTVHYAYTQSVTSRYHVSTALKTL